LDETLDRCRRHKDRISTEFRGKFRIGDEDTSENTSTYPELAVVPLRRSLLFPDCSMPFQMANILLPAPVAGYKHFNWMILKRRRTSTRAIRSQRGVRRICLLLFPDVPVAVFFFRNWASVCCQEHSSGITYL